MMGLHDPLPTQEFLSLTKLTNRINPSVLLGAISREEDDVVNSLDYLRVYHAPYIQMLEEVLVSSTHC